LTLLQHDNPSQTAHTTPHSVL